MTQSELLSLCHYYHGEKKCPFDEQTQRPQCLFWSFEEMFVRHTLSNPTFMEAYIAEAQDYICSHPNLQNDLTSSRFPLGTKAIILYCQAMLTKWCPYDVDLIFRYGNEEM